MIPIVNPQGFVKEYFNHKIVKEDGYNLKEVTPQDLNCFFSISAIAGVKKYLNLPVESIKTTFFEVIFITKGYSTVTENLNDIKQIKNQIRFVAPGKICAINELSDDVEGYYCLFDQAFIETFSGMSKILQSFSFFDLDAISVLTLTDEQSAFFEILLHKMKQDFTSNYEKSKTIICNHLISIFKECNLFYEKIIQENNNLTSADKITNNFLRLVNKYYLTKRTLSEYAELLNVTPKHLTKCVKQATNETPMHFIFNMLILEAKVLLKESKLSASEIAYHLSFEDASYFNKFFKKHTDFTPLGFRNNK